VSETAQLKRLQKNTSKCLYLGLLQVELKESSSFFISATNKTDTLSPCKAQQVLTQGTPAEAKGGKYLPREPRQLFVKLSELLLQSLAPLSRSFKQFFVPERGGVAFLGEEVFAL